MSNIFFSTPFVFFFILCGVSVANDSPYKAYLNDWAPATVCNMDETNDSSQMYGLVHPICISVIERLEWVEGQDYLFECIGWPVVLDELAENEKALWLPSITINSERMTLGWLFPQVIFFLKSSF